jgi:RNA recognition motif-containing protein
VDAKELENIFSGFGKVRAVEVVEDKAIGQCKGFAFIRYLDMEGVFAALDFEGPIEVHDSVTKETRTIKVTIADPRNELFVKLPRCSEEDAIAWLKSVLPIDLPLKKFRMERMPSGESKGFGFIRFVNHEEAVRALHVLRDVFFDGRRISVEMSDQKVLDPRLMCVYFTSSSLTHNP